MSTFLCGKADCTWLRETHLKGLELPEFQSCDLHGNEDCPTKLILFKSIMPLYTAAPVAVYILQDDHTYQAHPDPGSFANPDVHSPKTPTR